MVHLALSPLNGQIELEQQVMEDEYAWDRARTGVEEAVIAEGAIDDTSVPSGSRDLGGCKP
jgi:hypothetical protein